jgi:hypothetical protein
MRILEQWGCGLLAALAITAGCLVYTPAAVAQAPAGPAIPRQFPVLPSRFAGGAGQFSGPINSVVPEVRPVPSLDYIPGTSIPTIRGLWTGTVPNGPGVASTNVFGAFYANPLAATRPYAFGAPLYDLSQAVNATIAPSALNSQSPSVFTATSAATTGQQASPDLTSAPNTATVVVGNPYAATNGYIGPRVNVPRLNLVSTTPATPTASTPLQVREELQGIIDRSSTLSPRDSIRVLGDGLEVVLRGTVTSEYARQFAEALVLLSPGVQTVRNELTIAK